MWRKTQHCRKDFICLTEESQRFFNKWLLLFKMNYLSELQLFVTFCQSETANVVFYEKAILKDFAIFTGFQTCNLIEKRLQHLFFPVNNKKKLRRPILKNIYKWLLLYQCPGAPIDSYLGSIAHILIFKLLSSFL